MRKKCILHTILVFVLLLAITNITTYLLTENYVGKEEPFKNINYENPNVSDMKNVRKKVVDASFHINKEKIKDIQNVMIVAHPDDETLWAGDHIRKNKYLIVCLTNEDNSTRKKEFMKAMELTGNYGIILNYPDNPKHIKSNWKKVKGSIRKDIEYVLNYKKWSSIVTHNPDGEYGHIQHKFTSMLVTNECAKLNNTDKLYYFEKFYKPKYILEKNPRETLNEQDIQMKKHLMNSIYLSQKYAYGLYQHMIPFENLIEYKNWYFGY